MKLKLKISSDGTTGRSGQDSHEANPQPVKMSVDRLDNVQFGLGEKILVRNKDFIYHLAEVITKDEKLDTLEVRFCGSKEVIATSRYLVLDPKEWLAKDQYVFVRVNPGSIPEVYDGGYIREVIEQGPGEPARFSVRIKDQTKYLNMEYVGIKHTTVLNELKRRKIKLLQWWMMRFYVALWVAIALICFSGWTGIEWHGGLTIAIAIWVCVFGGLIPGMALLCLEPPPQDRNSYGLVAYNPSSALRLGIGIFGCGRFVKDNAESSNFNVH